MIICIDPGSSGGIVTLDNSGNITAKKLPSGIKELKAYIIDKHLGAKKNEVKIIIEKLAFRPSDIDQVVSAKDPVKRSMAKGKVFNVVKSIEGYNRILGMFESSGYNYVPVMPQAWQKGLALQSKTYDKRKKELKSIAENKFEQVRVTLANCDALLILDFYLRKTKFEPDWFEKQISADV